MKVKNYKQKKVDAPQKNDSLLKIFWPFIVIVIASIAVIIGVLAGSIKKIFYL